jgi:Glyoxalase-like domain
MVDHRLDHLVYATPNVEETVENLFQSLGVRAVVGGQHVGWGTHNCLASLGDGVYLEIVGPDPRQPEPDHPRPFLIDHITSPRLVTWAVSVPDMAAALARSKAAGYDPGPAQAMSRATPDGGTLAWELTSPPFGDDGGVVPFILAWGSTVHPSTTTVKGLSLVSLTATHPRPEHVNRVLQALGASLAIERGPKPLLEARLRGPAGEVVLHS